MHDSLHIPVESQLLHAPVMSTSKTRRQRGRERHIAALAGEVKAGFRLPGTVSRPALLDRGSDERFRRLVYVFSRSPAVWRWFASIWEAGWVSARRNTAC